MSKKNNESVLKQVAEVRIGNYEMTLTEEALQMLFAAHQSGNPDDEPSFLEEIIDFLIEIGTREDDNAAHILAHLGVLQRAKTLYRNLNELNIRRSAR